MAVWKGVKYYIDEHNKAKKKNAEKNKATKAKQLKAQKKVAAGLAKDATAGKNLVWLGTTNPKKKKAKAKQHTVFDSLMRQGGLSATKAQAKAIKKKSGAKKPVAKQYLNMRGPGTVAYKKPVTKKPVAKKAGSAKDGRTVVQRRTDLLAKQARVRQVAVSGKPKPAPKTSKPAPKPVAKPKPDPIVTQINNQIASNIQQNNRLTDFYLTQNEGARQKLVADGGKLADAANAYTAVTDAESAGTPGRDALLEAANKARIGATSGLIARNTGSLSDLFGVLGSAQRSNKTEYARRMQANRQAMIDEARDNAATRALKDAQTRQALAATQLAAKEFGINTQFKYDQLNQQGALGRARLQLDAAKAQTSAKQKAAAAATSAGQKELAAAHKWVNAHLYRSVTTSKKDPVTGENKSVTTRKPRPDMDYVNIMKNMVSQGFSPAIAASYALQLGDPAGFGNGQKSNVINFALQVYKNLILVGVTPKRARALVSSKYGSANAAKAQKLYGKKK